MNIGPLAQRQRSHFSQLAIRREEFSNKGVCWLREKGNQEKAEFSSDRIVVRQAAVLYIIAVCQTVYLEGGE
jgi:hypothetical protein